MGEEVREAGNKCGSDLRQLERYVCNIVLISLYRCDLVDPLKSGGGVAVGRCDGGSK